MKLAAIQRAYSIRTSLLVLLAGSVPVAVAHFFFESAIDVQVQIVGTAVSLFISLVGGWIFVLRPVSQVMRNDVERRDRDFEERFKDIVESMQEGVIVFDKNGAVSWNQAALKKLEVLEDDLRGRRMVGPAVKLMTESGWPLSDREWPAGKCFNDGIAASEVVGLQSSDGRTKWLRVHTSPVYLKRTHGNGPTDQPSAVDSVIVTLRDITSERTALQRFELAMKAVNFGVWDLDLVSGVLNWDETMYELYELEPSTLKRGSDFFDSCIVEADRPRVKQTFEQALRERRDLSTEFRIQLPSGKLRVLRAESKGFYASDGRPLRHVGVNWDVTEERERDLRFLQASKMSTLGEMSGGLAHEINNPLAIILGKIEAMRSALEVPTLDRELLNRHIETVDRTANRIAKIVNALRTFSRDAGEDPFEVTSAREIIAQTMALCGSRFLNNGIELHVAEVPAELKVKARPVQISQVLLNLLSNAFDAVSVLDERWVRLEVRANGQNIEFSVTDSGSGIPESIRAKLTQPFFTTKEIGVGTGLGLSIAAGIVRAHRGTLEIDKNSPNTRFAIRIPQPKSDSDASAT
jgi:PAS domain S-box-containing protein